MKNIVIGIVGLAAIFVTSKLLAANPPRYLLISGAWECNSKAQANTKSCPPSRPVLLILWDDGTVTWSNP